MRDLDLVLGIIKKYEGKGDGNKATTKLDPYLCPAGYWTIGYGHLVRGKDGLAITGVANKAKALAVYPTGITEAEAEALLREDVKKFVSCVESKVKVPLNNNQFAALVSFCFNVGCGNFSASTLLRILNKGNYDSVPVQLLRWDKSNGVALAGLTKRRKEEGKLWSTAV